LRPWRIEPTPITINHESPDTPDAIALIDELEACLAPLYPRESRHGYSVEKLLAQGVAFFLIRDNGAPVACGGIQLYGKEYAELKRMYVRPQHRGSGHAKMMLRHLADYARNRGVPLLRLETGIHQTAAIGLYERAGFQSVPPFGEYKPDPLSRFYEKRINPGD
jgi:putative acetyltransferase